MKTMYNCIDTLSILLLYLACIKLLIDVNLINANMYNTPNFNEGLFFSLMKEQVCNNPCNAPRRIWILSIVKNSEGYVDDLTIEINALNS